ncbi:MAG: WecB/TagA/CpsF family glycosyltransferase [Pirellulales bacterium]
MPAFLERHAERGFKVYLLGGAEDVNADTAESLRRRYPSWNVVGRHHGFVQTEESAEPVIAEIQKLKPDVLIVAMGNPLQEQWLAKYRERLPVKLSFGVGGLFDYMAGRNRRAPLWIRKLGHEWLSIVLRQPHKWKRYVLGNPLFLARVAAHFLADRKRTREWRVESRV